MAGSSLADPGAAVTDHADRMPYAGSARAVTAGTGM